MRAKHEGERACGSWAAGAKSGDSNVFTNWRVVPLSERQLRLRDPGDARRETGRRWRQQSSVLLRHGDEEGRLTSGRHAGGVRAGHRVAIIGEPFSSAMMTIRPHEPVHAADASPARRASATVRIAFVHAPATG